MDVSEYDSCANSVATTRLATKSTTTASGTINSTSTTPSHHEHTEIKTYRETSLSPATLNGLGLLRRLLAIPLLCNGLLGGIGFPGFFNDMTTSFASSPPSSPLSSFT